MYRQNNTCSSYIAQVTPITADEKPVCIFLHDELLKQMSKYMDVRVSKHNGGYEIARSKENHTLDASKTVNYFDNASMKLENM